GRAFAHDAQAGVAGRAQPREGEASIRTGDGTRHRREAARRIWLALERERRAANRAAAEAEGAVDAECCPDRQLGRGGGCVELDGLWGGRAARRKGCERRA